MPALSRIHRAHEESDQIEKGHCRIREEVELAGAIVGGVEEQGCLYTRTRR